MIVVYILALIVTVLIHRKMFPGAEFKLSKNPIKSIYLLFIDIAESSWNISKMIFTKPSDLTGKFVKVTLPIERDSEYFRAATAITLTPGTIAAEESENGTTIHSIED